MINIKKNVLNKLKMIKSISEWKDYEINYMIGKSIDLIKIERLIIDSVVDDQYKLNEVGNKIIEINIYINEIRSIISDIIEIDAKHISDKLIFELFTEDNVRNVLSTHHDINLYKLEIFKDVPVSNNWYYSDSEKVIVVSILIDEIVEEYNNINYVKDK